MTYQGLIGVIVAGVMAAVALVADETCFFQHEELAGGNKICYYSCPSGEAASTVLAYDLCPLQLHR